MTTPTSPRFEWHELMTANAVEAATFYTRLFGWTVQEMDAGTYRIFNKGTVGVGGCMQGPAGSPSNWLAYVGSEDTRSAAQKIVALGGKLVVPPQDVPDMVRFTVASDPQGAVFGVVQNLAPRPMSPLSQQTPTPGMFCWDELHAKDMDVAQKYYAALFGWTGHMNEGAMKYWHWASGGKELGGMMPLMIPNVPSFWLPYIAESDVDGASARVKDLGGKVVMGPMEMPKVGKFAIVQDPQGATFALFRSARV